MNHMHQPSGPVNPQGGPGSVPQQTIVLKVMLTTDEASLILNKLNVAQFTGFAESGVAMSILGKIQSADKVPAASLGPTKEQMNEIKDQKPTSLTKLRDVIGKDAQETLEKKTPVQFTPPPASIIKEVESPKPEETVDAITEDKDERPGAPLKALDEAKAEPLVEEIKEEGNENIPPEDTPAFGVIDRSAEKKKDGTESYI